MLRMLTFEVTPFFQNARVLIDDQSSEAVIIDPGGEPERMLAALEQHNVRCNQIWLTHSHIDHCGAVHALLARTGADLYAHAADKSIREAIEETALEHGLSRDEYKNCPEPRVYLSHGQTLTVGSHSFEVIHTPGHSPGHVAFYNRAAGYIISGDSLFRECIGRVSLPGGDSTELLRTISSVLLALPRETTVLCGHGPETSVGHELDHNPFIRTWR